MKQWFYSESNQQRGPISEQELKQLLDSHTLPSDTLVWSEGLNHWTAASSFPEFTPSPYATPSAAPNAAMDWSGYTPSGAQVRPWTRYWARTFDFLLFCLVFGIFVVIAYPQFLEMSDMLVGIVLLAAYNIAEPVMFAMFGTTPLKALLNVRVRNTDGSRLSFLQALVRTLKVWIGGMGLGIPLISLFTHLSSYSRLKNQGITSWDESGPFVVSHQNVAWWRWLILVLFIVGFIGLMVLGAEAA